MTTPKLADVIAVAARHGAVVRAIGDDRQLGAIGSGGALRLLNNEVGAVGLEEVHRFRTEGESEASLALREPPAAGADTPFHWYLENKRVTAGTTEAMTHDALAAWMADIQAGKTSLLVATENATVTDLNARAQAARITTGELTDGAGPITEATPSMVLRDGLRAYAGDAVVTRKNDRTLQVNQGKDFVKNNDVWTVEKVTADPATIPAADAAAGEERQLIAAGDSELAQQVAKDPYAFEFLGLSGEVAERDLEQALMDRIAYTLRELGPGFAFVGRQVHLEVSGDDFYIDLLFFHVEQLRYVVIELKTGKFQPEYAGKLNFHVALVDDKLRREAHNDTVGILICGSKNDHTVRYALGRSESPMAVSTYTYETLPAADELAAAFDEVASESAE